MRDGKPATVDVTLANLEENPNELIAGVHGRAGHGRDLRRKQDIDPRITGPARHRGERRIRPMPTYSPRIW